jgi:preprotein translocase subunit SecE
LNKLLDFGKKCKSFLRESKAELKKVSWPTRKQVWYSTLVVLGLTFVVGVYLGAVDAILSILMTGYMGGGGAQ